MVVTLLGDMEVVPPGAWVSPIPEWDHYEVVLTSFVRTTSLTTITGMTGVVGTLEGNAVRERWGGGERQPGIYFKPRGHQSVRGSSVMPEDRAG
jgi:hypothetical protein